MLGPLLFLIYINDLDIGLSSRISKFADDTKIGLPINQENYIKIKNDLKMLEIWSNQWMLEFNVQKYKVMHIGKKNPNFNYSLYGNNIECVDKQRDLGVIISNDLKYADQCDQAYKKANRMLGLISRTISHKSKYTILPLYTSLVRPHLEYCVQHWSPHLVKDINKLEAVQRRATKLIRYQR